MRIKKTWCRYCTQGRSCIPIPVRSVYAGNVIITVGLSVSALASRSGPTCSCTAPRQQRGDNVIVRVSHIDKAWVILRPKCSIPNVGRSAIKMGPQPFSAFGAKLVTFTFTIEMSVLKNENIIALVAQNFVNLPRSGAFL